MIVLTATTDNLQLVLDAAHTSAALKVVTCWRDITTTDYTPGRTRTDSNGTTDVNIVPAPAASTQRVVDFITVYKGRYGQARRQRHRGDPVERLAGGG